MAETLSRIDQTDIVKNKEVRAENEPSRQNVDARAFEFISKGAPGSLGLYYQQTQERKTVDQKYGKTPEKSIDTAELLEKTKKELYSLLGIHENTESNGTIGKVQKGVVDGLIMDNIDFAKQIIEVGLENVIKEILSLIGSFDKVLAVMSTMFEELKGQIQNIAKLDPYDGGKLIGGMGFGMVGSLARGVGKNALKTAVKHEMRKESTVVKQMNEIAEKKTHSPTKIGEIEKTFNNLTPKEALDSIKSLNGNLGASELINIKGGLRNFSKTIENISQYIGKNHEKLGSLKGEYINEIYNFKKTLKEIIRDPALPERDVLMIKHIAEQDLTNTIYLLNPKIGPQK